MPKVEIVSLPEADDDLRAERHMIMMVGIALSSAIRVVDEDLLAAIKVLNERGDFPFTKDEMKRALGRIELVDLISRDDEGVITLTTKGQLMGCLIETVGVEGGVIRISTKDDSDDAPVDFEALKCYGEDNPANPEF